MESLWSYLPTNTQNAISINFFKVKVRGPNDFNQYHRFSTGKPSIWLIRLRLVLSALNFHRFTYNFIDSPGQYVQIVMEVKNQQATIYSNAVLLCYLE